MKSYDIPKYRDFSIIELPKNELTSDELYLCVLPCAEDILVYMSIGVYIFNTTYENEESYKSMTSYYDEIRSRKPVKRLFVVDLQSSLSTINIDALLQSLSEVVKNDIVMKYIHYMRDLSIDGISGIKLTNIPKTSILTDALLDYYLKNLDIEFKNAYPELNYHRFIHEVIITLPENL